MANNVLKASIQAQIHANGSEEITGPVLQNVLTSVVNQLGSGATLVGKAIPSTMPPNFDNLAYYIADEGGIYPGFGGVELLNEVAIFHNIGGSWAKISLGPRNTNFNIVDVLPDLSYLPPTGGPGDVYFIQGHMWVWSPISAEYIDAGPLQGPPGTPVVIEVMGNQVFWRYEDSPLYTLLFDLIELGTATMTYAQRIALTGVRDGAKVFQTDGAKGEYQYVSGKWYFIGNKLTKQISTQYYTLQIADIGYLLEFTLDVPATEVEVTIPNSVFADAHIIDMIQRGASKVKFIADSGVTLNVDSIYPNKRTYSKFAEAKLRFKSASECVLVGGLE